MKKITLTNSNKKCIVDDEDYKWINQWGWGITANGYVIRYEGNARKKELRRTFLIHNIIMNCPKTMRVDHINHNPLDNRKNNLRICTIEQNNRNISLRKTSISGYKGVSWYNRQSLWHAQIGYNKKNIHIGLFKNKLHAAMAYDMWAKDLHGEFANLNFPDTPMLPPA